jgi:hypothetical protein
MRFCLKKKPSQKWAGEVAQGVDPEFKPGTAKKKVKFGPKSWEERTTKELKSSSKFILSLNL